MKSCKGFLALLVSSAIAITSAVVLVGYDQPNDWKVVKTEFHQDPNGYPPVYDDGTSKKDSRSVLGAGVSNLYLNWDMFHDGTKDHLKQVGFRVIFVDGVNPEDFKVLCRLRQTPTSSWQYCDPYNQYDDVVGINSGTVSWSGNVALNHSSSWYIEMQVIRKSNLETVFTETWVVQENDFSTTTTLATTGYNYHVYYQLLGETFMRKILYFAQLHHKVYDSSSTDYTAEHREKRGSGAWSSWASIPDLEDTPYNHAKTVYIREVAAEGPASTFPFQLQNRWQISDSPQPTAAVQYNF